MKTETTADELIIKTLKESNELLTEKVLQYLDEIEKLKEELQQLKLQES